VTDVLDDSREGIEVRHARRLRRPWNLRVGRLRRAPWREASGYPGGLCAGLKFFRGRDTDAAPPSRLSPRTSSAGVRKRCAEKV